MVKANDRSRHGHDRGETSRSIETRPNEPRQGRMRCSPVGYREGRTRQLGIPGGSRRRGRTFRLENGEEWRQTKEVKRGLGSSVVWRKEREAQACFQFVGDQENGHAPNTKAAAGAGSARCVSVSLPGTAGSEHGPRPYDSLPGPSPPPLPLSLALPRAATVRQRSSAGRGYLGQWRGAAWRLRYWVPGKWGPASVLCCHSYGVRALTERAIGDWGAAASDTAPAPPHTCLMPPCRSWPRALGTAAAGAHQRHP